MAAIALLGAATFDTASGTKTVTATPTIGDLIVIITAHTSNTSAATPTDDNSGGTYTTITTSVKNSSADTLMIHIRNSPITSAASTIFTHAPGSSTGGGLVVLRVTGMSRAGSNASKQTAALQQNQASGGTPAPVFGAAPGSDSPIIAALFNATNPAGITHRTGYTEHADTGYNSPATGLEVMSLNAGETSATITWGGTSASAFSDAAVELDTSVPTTVSFDAVGPAGGGGTSSTGTGFTTLTWSHICNGFNRLLLVGVGLGDIGDAETCTATYNGVAMTSEGKIHNNNATDGYVQMFSLVNPAVGANNVVVTISDALDNVSAVLVAGSVSFSNVDQITPTSGVVTAAGNGTGPTVNVTSAVGEMVADALGNGSAITSSTQTNRWVKNVNTTTGGGNAAQSTAAGAASVTMAYVVATDTWGIVALSVRPANRQPRALQLNQSVKRASFY